jgi:hypothetical protein
MIVKAKKILGSAKIIDFLSTTINNFINIGNFTPILMNKSKIDRGER